MGQFGTVSPKQFAAIEALLTCRTVSDAAASIGVNRKTIQRWLNDALFASALNEAKADATRHATRRLAGALGQSVSTVINLAESSEDEALRLRAALSVATMLRELSEHGDFEERLSALEALQVGTI